MKNKRIFKTLSALCAALVLMGGFSVTAFAQGTEQPPAEDATNDEDVVVEETEDSPALTPEGNVALVDDFGGNKQLITVTTKAGNYFYILIDRANEDKETAVHFLNQVDEADLMALMEDGQSAEKPPAVCNCTEKCEAGAVNTKCEVCSTDMTGCTGKEPEPETPEEPAKPEKKESAGLNPAVLLLVLAVMPTSNLLRVKPTTKTAAIQTIMTMRTARNCRTRKTSNWRTRNRTSWTLTGAAVKKVRMRPHDPVYRQPL